MTTFLSVTFVVHTCPSQVFVDINGSRDIPTLWRLIDKLKNVLKPELFIVKSVKIRMMLKQCVQYEEADEEVVDTQDKRQKAGDPEGQDAWRERHHERKPGEEGAEADEKTCPACGVYDSTEISEEKVLGVVEWASIAVGSVVLFLLGVRVGKAL